MTQSQKVQVENVNHPGNKQRLDQAKYDAMKEAYLQVLPAATPGLTVAEIRERLTDVLSQEHFPGGAKAGWWAKAVQLDLEAKGVVKREKTSPIRLYLA
ncbi:MULTISPECIES: hypothetical protein [unclassified Phyllobacterium]|uniref:DUF6958 family protein n=1 Tax=Phyllobacterium TaxID=28100 RepID=UPI000DD920EE|nr:MULTISPECIES: hypothetical protein [unclassified Phyllobacterium]MBA8899259.1 hypothetical protein [Phyllobacterium sp. P30BS-XVII]UGX85296.1 hypothetical protein LLE53_012575 [Phyllobacterium sp. T1293]